MGEQFPGDQNIRVSDSERSAALAALGQFYAEGRLTMQETDERCEAVADAKDRSDLNKIFFDLPYQEIVAVDRVEPTYTASEVATLHRNGARPRAGILGLTTVAAITGTAVLSSTTPFAAVLLALIPIVFILLYVMKVGPDSWYAPTPRQLERRRMAELREKEKRRDLELKAQRRERTHALTTRALDAAETVFETKPWKRK
ncbi:hypothetical protein CDES_12750 [Corynebacterium deserti GIMN1.010]|uniref:DUF1707 domain-containing protein n=1 Tax=Corynebacterium deserti GIMN1.010 TaxID=931089 RepID=A0A0M5IGM2_9CORY|nr:DUF1707 domain-containing protein [Corynebacterium deserti]ALC06894.1 hypothetical protein CDES_12750 [Corynebacterium deserti GIMN1.010]